MKNKLLPGAHLDYNLFKEEWLAMRGSAEHHNIVIEQANKGSRVVVSDQKELHTEADRQLYDNRPMKAVTYGCRFSYIG